MRTVKATAAEMRPAQTGTALPKSTGTKTPKTEATEISPVTQKQLLAFLLDRRSYSHRPRNVRLIQTHASYVSLAAPYVFKVKKPVNFGFLDFSTLEKRRYFSEREISLNRRLSSDVHLGVVPIYLREGTLTFDAGSEPVEYAVKMRKLEDRYFLSRLLKRNEVGRRELDRIVSTLKAFYESQKPADDIVKWGRIEKLKISTRENFRQIESFVGTTISTPAFEAIRSYTDDFYRRNACLFESRVRERRIGDCHGDLHLDHIHLSPTQLSIYDCIEFNDRFRYIDHANDIAFLAMDFDYEGRRDLSRYLTKRMADALCDQGILKLMDFYKCYRAFVRGKVDSLQGAGTRLERDRTKIRAHARRYFQLALQYAVCGSEPMVVVIIGRIGSGKSTLANSLGRELGWEVFSSDRTRKELAGAPLYKRGGPVARRRLYTEAMASRTYKALVLKATKRALEGHCSILDATFSHRHHREMLKHRLERKRLGYCFVEARAPDAVVKRRLARRDGESREISDARLEDFEALDGSYERPVELATRELATVSTAKALEVTTADTLKALALRASRRTRGS
jgi:aminoglycoside phosphotransferase family enzyme/predicted kinase